MKKRCDNKNSRSYGRYGARGIRLCQEWENDFRSFSEWALKSGYSDELTIDRVDNSEGYSPENCRWVTHNDQAKNKRNNIFIAHNGIEKILADCAEITIFHTERPCSVIETGSTKGNQSFLKDYFIRGIYAKEK